ncbi:Polynucleotidyl transferase [Perilla frutescens var. hirtella]|uniref:Polynucleotidyl transferase n=1 Tax=Perilla frutescens var. hirtella TaxID=608512 RepID=A0AAD4IRH5_PERFH|nr:Polynucleotidyl transferase [Perilla frutescens var. hirtella]
MQVPPMAIQFIALKPLLSPIKQNPLPIKYKNSTSLRSGTQLSVTAAVSVPVSVPWEEQIPPNAVLRKRTPSWRGGFSLGVDLGLSRTGVAISKGFTVRPLTVLELRGQKLELRLLDLAEKEEVDEFIIGLPKNSDGKETEQSNKVRSVAGRFAVRAAERGWRVYLQDEHGTSSEALDHMIAKGLSKSAREGRLDAYAAMKVLERYFEHSGKEIELVVPKQVELQNKLRKGPPKDIDFFPEESQDL